MPSGEKVRHHPPDEAHSEGKLELTHEGSALKDRLDAARDDNQRRHDHLKAVHTERIEDKKAEQADKGLPGEKSPI